MVCSDFAKRHGFYSKNLENLTCKNMDASSQLILSLIINCHNKYLYWERCAIQVYLLIQLMSQLEIQKICATSRPYFNSHYISIGKVTFLKLTFLFWYKVTFIHHIINSECYQVSILSGVLMHPIVSKVIYLCTYDIICV